MAPTGTAPVDHRQQEPQLGQKGYVMESVYCMACELLADDNYWLEALETHRRGKTMAGDTISRSLHVPRWIAEVTVREVLCSVLYELEKGGAWTLA